MKEQLDNLKNLDEQIIELTNEKEINEEIANAGNLSEVNKFNHLKTLVHGAAATTTAGLSLTSASYRVALDLLKGRFANQQVIISAHMKRLLKLPSMPLETS